MRALALVVMVCAALGDGSALESAPPSSSTELTRENKPDKAAGSDQGQQRWNDKAGLWECTTHSHHRDGQCRSPSKQNIEDALARSVKTKEIVLGEGLEGGKGSVLPTSANRRTLGADPTQNPTQNPTRNPTARKCHSTCKTCTGPLAVQCTSCSAAGDRSIGAWKFKEHEGKRVPEGPCMAPPALKDFNPSLGGVECSFSECRDATTGYALGVKQPYATTDKTVCSRVCLIGGRITNVVNLERYDNPEKRTGRRKVDAKFSYAITGAGSGKHILFEAKLKAAGADSLSQPVCSLHKIAMCTKNKDFHHGNCQKFRNKQAGGKAAHCEQENCHVQKKVDCVAIIPFARKMKDTVHKVLGADLSAYTNECRHAINPCDTVALYM